MSWWTRLWDRLGGEPPPDIDVTRVEREERMAQVERRMEELVRHDRQGLADTRSLLTDFREVRRQLAEEPFLIVGQPKDRP